MRTRLPLPRGWKRRVKSSVVHVLELRGRTPILRRPKSLVQYTNTTARKFVRSDILVCRGVPDQVPGHRRIRSITAVSTQ